MQSPRFLKEVKRVGKELGHVIDFSQSKNYSSGVSLTSSELEKNELDKLKKYLDRQISGDIKSVFFNRDLFHKFTDKKFRSKYKAVFRKLLQDAKFQEEILVWAEKLAQEKITGEKKRAVEEYVQQLLTSKNMSQSFATGLQIRFFRFQEMIQNNPIVRSWFLQTIDHPALKHLVQNSLSRILQDGRLLETKEGRKLFLGIVPHPSKFNLPPMQIFHSILFSQYADLLKQGNSLEPFQMIASDSKLSRSFIDGVDEKGVCERILSNLKIR